MSHAKLSPSSAYRWIACGGSLLAPPERESSEDADYGTAGHTLASWVLADHHKTTSYYRDNVIDVKNDDGTVRRQFTVEDEMADYVQVYVDTIRDRVTGDAQLLIEQTLDTGLVSKRYGAVTGTGDAIILRPFEGVIEVHDLKLGYRKVLAKNNWQLLLYAIAAARQYAWLMPTGKIKVAIHQPRLDHYDEHEYTIEELLDKLDEVSERIAQLDNGDVSQVPGDDQCKHCTLLPTCEGARKHTKKFLLDFPIVEDLTEYGIAAAMNEVELVEMRCAAIRAEARRLLDNGEKVPGWTLEEGRQGNRKWADEKAAVAEMYPTLRDDAYKPQTPISPADAEKKLSKKHPTIWAKIQQYIVRGAPTVNMVRDDGKRKPLAASVMDDFKAVS